MDLSYIERYLGWNVCLIPIAHKSKKPTVEWKQYQKHKPTKEEMRGWFNGKESNVAIVCGEVSDNLVVLDCDSPELFVALNDAWVKKYKQKVDTMTPIVQTGGGGYHIYLKVKYKPQLYHPVGEDRKTIPDIQSEGGYVLAPPSIHPNGNPYRLLNPQVKDIFHIQSLIDLGIIVPTAKEPPQKDPGWVTKALQGVGQGERDNTCTKLAGYFRNLVPQDVATTILLSFAEKCTPPLDEKSVLKCVNSTYRLYKPAVREEPPPFQELDNPPPYNPPSYNNTLYIRDVAEELPSEPKRFKNVSKSVSATSGKNETPGKAFHQKESLADIVLSWVKGTTGWWATDELDRDLGILGSQRKAARRLILFRLKEQGIIESHQKLNKQWRYINTEITNLAFKTASTTGIINIKWPTCIERFVNLFPGNLVVVAGSPNSGKTAFALEFIYLNDADWPITYVCSEMGAVELRNRLEKFSDRKIEDWKFNAIERASDFGDVVVPDCVTIIDYLEMTNELFEVNTHLTKIAHRIGSGLAIVLIQKKLNAAFGRGQEFSLEKPKMYLSLDRGIMRMIKAKCWAKPQVDPCGMQVSFKITGGCHFVVSKDWEHKQ